MGKFAAGALTFGAVVVAWVFFRAPDVGTAVEILKAMAGANGIAAPESLRAWLGNVPAASGPVDSFHGLVLALSLLALAWLTPNTQEITGYAGPERADRAGDARGIAALRWRPSLRWAAMAGGLFGVAFVSLSKVSEFLYFQF
jgi:hypothetical protein